VRNTILELFLIVDYSRISTATPINPIDNLQRGYEKSYKFPISLYHHYLFKAQDMFEAINNNKCRTIL
jgi:hypothetical protein